MSTTLLLFSAIGGLAVMLALHFWLDRRAFYRRNSHGLETFDGYGQRVRVRALEGLARLVQLAACLIGFGSLLGLVFVFMGLK